MDPRIAQICEKNSTTEIHFTHVMLTPPYGKFQINRYTLEELWGYYCKEIHQGNFKYGMAEKPQQHIPAVADIDLKVSEEANPYETDNLYTMDQLQAVVQIYQSVLRDIVEDCDDSKLTCVVLEKPPYRVQVKDAFYIKNGFHLHFPKIFLDRAEQEVHLLPRVKKLIKEQAIFEALGIEDSSTVVDKGCYSANWLMYGSVKDLSMNPYLVTRVYDANMQEQSLEDAFGNYLIYDKNDRAIDIRGRVKYYLPRILSIIPFSRDTMEVKAGLPPVFKIVAERVSNQRVYDKKTVTENLDMAKRLLPMLDDSRAEDRNEWMSVGWVLHNISEGSEEGLHLWLNFSQRCPDKYQEDKCIYEWDKMHESDMTIGTLKYYASVDSPERYQTFKREERERHVENIVSGTHNDLAKLLYSEYANEFVCVSVAKKIWYRFQGHFWHEIESGRDLREKISSVLAHMFQEQYKKFVNEHDNLDDPMVQIRLKQLQKIMNDCKNAPFKDNVMKEACEVFYDPRFANKLNTNPYLIGFKNGVFDLSDNFFRAGKPEDFISKHMPVNYVQFDEGDERVQRVYSFFQKIFPDKSLNTYFFEVNSDIFIGRNIRKIVQMWTGEGDNGKSVTQRFFEFMLGADLSIKVPTTLVTGNKPLSGAAWPEMARAGDGVRAAWLDEMGPEEIIRIGIFKQLSGNDKIPARDLFQKGKEMKDIEPMFKMFIIANKLSKFQNGGDKATWNRVCVFSFESTFCGPEDPAPDTFEEQLRQKRFPKDPDFVNQIPELAEAFAWILLQHKQRPKMSVPPEKVREAINRYKRQNDLYRQFAEERIVDAKDKKITLNELYTAVVDWYKSSYPNMSRESIPSREDIREYFEKQWGRLNARFQWVGYVIRTASADDDIVYVDEDEFKPATTGKPAL